MSVETNHSNYLRNIFQSKASLADTIRRCELAIRDAVADEGLEFDYIVCRGVSGITIASILAHTLDKGLIVVRKDKSNSHAMYGVEGLPSHGIVKYIIVDDFISSGQTFVKIVEGLAGQKTNMMALCFEGCILHAQNQEEFNNPEQTIEHMYLYQAQEFKSYL